MNLKLLCLCLFVTCLTLSTTVESANILGIFTTISKSHSIQGHGLLQGLAEKGHNVTMVTCHPSKRQLKNFRELVPKVNLKRMFYGTDEINVFDLMKSFTISNVFTFFTSNPKITDTILSDETIQALLKSGDQYDVVIVVSFLNEPLYAIANHFKAPLIVYSLSGASVFTDDLVGNPTPYAYVPILTSSNRLTFIERVTNTLAGVGIDLLRNYIYFPMQETVRAKHFPNGPDLKAIMKDTSIVLLNSYASISMPRPMVPNMIEIGGFQMKSPKPLPADLQSFMDNAKDGVIYFSLGSNVLSKHMPVEIKNTIMEVFSKVKQQVLWKWEEDVLPGQPKNVKISKWLPQTDLLAHPNLRLFITHGGWGSICEAIASGVPLIGVPVMGDQYNHVQEMAHQGYGVRVDLTNITVQSLGWAINEVVNKPSYKEKMTEIKNLYNDREINPLDRATYWIEHVIRTKGAKHLRSPALNLKQYELLLLDVLGFLGLIFAIIGFIMFWVSKKVFGLCCGRSKKVAKKSTKKTN